MSTVQKYLAGLIGLGALLIVSAPNNTFFRTLGAGQTFVSGTLHTAITGQA